MILLKFYTTKLDSTSVFVFGHNWLHHYNLLIDWSAGQITYFRRLLPSVLSSARPGTNGSPEPPVASFTSASDPLPSVDSPSISVPLGNSSSPPSISFINAAAYVRLACVKGNTIFSISISVSDSVAGCSTSAEQVDLSSIPEDYHEFADVFSNPRPVLSHLIGLTTSRSTLKKVPNLHSEGCTPFPYPRCWCFANFWTRTCAMGSSDPQTLRMAHLSFS